jgi:1,4-alpha-glucan branching enzyme
MHGRVNADHLELRDPFLRPFEEEISRRYSLFMDRLAQIDQNEGGLVEFSKGRELFGLLKKPTGWTLREYLPDAVHVSLIGDFNGWSKDSAKLSKEPFGRWAITLPLDLLKHGHRYRIAVWAENGSIIERVPAWADYVVQNTTSKLYDAVVWDPPGGGYEMRNNRPPRPVTPIIYEAHVGISSKEPRVSSYAEFRIHVLPRLKRLGYNTLQLMAIVEHAFYGSFGYHVTSFFAPSSRFGTPDDLRRLIDDAHSMGIFVLLDVVHSHMSSSHLDGISAIDGSDHCYRHTGARGYHALWDSALFDYGKWEVERFLLSNLRHWIEGYRFDGFRFDGVTSMLYNHHGVGVGFTGNYSEYFGETSDFDVDAHVYLCLANQLIHTLFPEAITIAEDVSGLPLLCRPIDEGGIGFDYRLAMAIADMWIRLMKDYKDEEWNMGNIVHTLTNRRWDEPTIAYAECHDQSLVGDKTLAMHLMDADLYDKMNYESDSPVIERGVALHKMIRLLTMCLGNNGYLNFMGNEFGHPEWLDFPREGNDWSFHWCRRRWDLADCGYLRYSDLERFDSAMLHLQETFRFLDSTDEYVFLKDESLKIIAFERGRALFIFNFHPTHALVDYSVPTRLTPSLRVVLDSDQKEFGGIGGRISHEIDMCVANGYVKVYIPPRSCAVLVESNRAKE